MRVLIFSPSDTDEKVYEQGEKKFKELGYEVYNPYHHKLDGESLNTTIYRLLLVVNMVVCISTIKGKYGKIDKDTIMVKDFCFRNGIIFRISDKDNDIHYTRWLQRKGKR
jgi:hypothetical protein